MNRRPLSSHPYPSLEVEEWNTVSDWKFGVVVSLLKQFATSMYIPCDALLVGLRGRGVDSLRGESLTRIIYDREGWEVDSSNQMEGLSGSHHFLLQSPCSIAPCTSCNIYKCGSTKMGTSQITIFIQCKSSKNSNPRQLPKIEVLTYKIPLEGRLNLQPKNQCLVCGDSHKTNPWVSSQITIFIQCKIIRKFKSSSITKKNLSLDIQNSLGGEAESTTQKSVPRVWRFA